MKKNLLILSLLILVIFLFAILYNMLFYKNVAYECEYIEKYSDELDSSIEYEIKHRDYIELSRDKKISKYYSGIVYSYDNEEERDKDIKDFELEDSAYEKLDNNTVYVYNNFTIKYLDENSIDEIIEKKESEGYTCKKR